MYRIKLNNFLQYTYVCLKLTWCDYEIIQSYYWLDRKALDISVIITLGILLLSRFKSFFVAYFTTLSIYTHHNERK